MVPAGGAPPPLSFGLIVIGDEVLNGDRQDAHLARFKRMLRDRGHALGWHWMLPDEPGVLVDHLRFSMSRPDPVVVTGGIGATPDDHTRACAAEAAGLPLERHPRARELIESIFGDRAYPFRILMADLPAGCSLVPNPFNRIPGFSLRGHYFLPGFPEMAWSMAEWILDTHYPPGAESLRELALRVFGVPESSLIPLMRRLGARYPGLKLFSLPHIGEDPHILLGFRGRTRLEEALEELSADLEAQGIGWSEAPQQAQEP